MLNPQRIKCGRYQNCWHSFKADWASSQISGLYLIWKIGEEVLHAVKHLGGLKNGLGVPGWREEVVDQCGMKRACCFAFKHFFFHPLPFWVCIFCSLYHWGTLKYHHVFFCLSGLDGRRVTRVDQMQRYLAQGPRRPSHSFPTAVTNSKWQPQKNIPCGVSSRSFLDCMIIRSDQMVMSPGMLSEWMLFNHSCWASSF